VTAAHSKKAEQAIYAAQAEGYAAYLEGKHPRDIPYKSSDPRCEPWIAGYAQARTDRAIENRKIT
jgi:ribosome modulation factor